MANKPYDREQDIINVMKSNPGMTRAEAEAQIDRNSAINTNLTASLLGTGDNPTAISPNKLNINLAAIIKRAGTNSLKTTGDNAKIKRDAVEGSVIGVTMNQSAGGFQSLTVTTGEGETVTVEPTVAMMTNAVDGGGVTVTRTSGKTTEITTLTGKPAANGFLTATVTQGSPKGIAKALELSVGASPTAIKAKIKETSSNGDVAETSYNVNVAKEVTSDVKTVSKKTSNALANPFGSLNGALGGAAGNPFANVLANLGAVLGGALPKNAGATATTTQVTQVSTTRANEGKSQFAVDKAQDSRNFALNSQLTSLASSALGISLPQPVPGKQATSGFTEVSAKNVTIPGVSQKPEVVDIIKPDGSTNLQQAVKKSEVLPTSVKPTDVPVQIAVGKTPKSWKGSYIGTKYENLTISSRKILRYRELKKETEDVQDKYKKELDALVAAGGEPADFKYQRLSVQIREAEKLIVDLDKYIAEEEQNNTTASNAQLVEKYEFTHINSKEELESEMRMLTGQGKRTITCMILYSTRTGTNQDIDMMELHKKHVKVVEKEKFDLSVFGGTQAHYLIRRDGSVQRGRPVSIPVLDGNVKVNGGWNQRTLCVFLAGGMDAEFPFPDNIPKTQLISSASYTPEQWKSLEIMAKAFRETIPGAEVITRDQQKGTKIIQTGFYGTEWAKNRFGWETLYFGSNDFATRYSLGLGPFRPDEINRGVPVEVAKPTVTPVVTKPVEPPRVVADPETGKPPEKTEEELESEEEKRLRIEKRLDQIDAELKDQYKAWELTAGFPIAAPRERIKAKITELEAERDQLTEEGGEYFKNRYDRARAASANKVNAEAAKEDAASKYAKLQADAGASNQTLVSKYGSTSSFSSLLQNAKTTVVNAVNTLANANRREEVALRDQNNSNNR